MKINYFTSTYPFGNSVSWKRFELDHLLSNGFEVNLIPFSGHKGSSVDAELDSSIKYYKPLVAIDKMPSIKRRLIAALFSSLTMPFLKELFMKGAISNKKRITELIIDTYFLLTLVNHPTIKELISENDEKTLWYFFWGRHSALLIPYLKQITNAKIACRVHGYDLYKERNDGYIPFQCDILNNADLLLPCSLDGMHYLQKNLAVDSRKIFVARLGTRSLGEITPVFHETLNIVSCSNVIPLKRIHLLIKSLKMIKFPFHWTHIGDGPLLPEFKRRVKDDNYLNDKVDFVGHLPSSKVIEFMKNSKFDLFINVSEFEGVPVSIMEAMSLGIPVIATNVGGTSEIVDNKIGYLIEKNSSPEQIAEVIKHFYNLNQTDRYALSHSSISRFKDLCDIDKNSNLLVDKFRMLFN